MNSSLHGSLFAHAQHIKQRWEEPSRGGGPSLEKYYQDPEFQLGDDVKELLGLTGPAPAWEAIYRSFLEPEARQPLVLVGRHGSGKSTAAQRFAYVKSLSALKRENARYRAMLVPLTQLEPGEPRVSLAHWLASEFGDGNPQIEDLETAILQGRVLLILDALDEAAGRLGDRQLVELMDYSRELHRMSDSARVVLTCRRDYFDHLTQGGVLGPENFLLVETLPFRYQSIDAIASAWSMDRRGVELWSRVRGVRPLRLPVILVYMLEKLQAEAERLPYFASLAGLPQDLIYRELRKGRDDLIPVPDRLAMLRSLLLDSWERSAGDGRVRPVRRKDIEDQLKSRKLQPAVRERAVNELIFRSLLEPAQPLAGGGRATGPPTEYRALDEDIADVLIAEAMWGALADQDPGPLQKAALSTRPSLLLAMTQSVSSDERPGRVAALRTLVDRLRNEGQSVANPCSLLARLHPEEGLQGLNLRGADLRDADLQGANLEGTDLEGARLDGATMWRCHMSGPVPAGVATGGVEVGRLRQLLFAPTEHALLLVGERALVVYDLDRFVLWREPLPPGAQFEVACPLDDRVWVLRENVLTLHEPDRWWEQMRVELPLERGERALHIAASARSPDGSILTDRGRLLVGNPLTGFRAIPLNHPAARTAELVASGREWFCCASPEGLRVTGGALHPDLRGLAALTSSATRRASVQVNSREVLVAPGDPRDPSPPLLISADLRRVESLALSETSLLLVGSSTGSELWNLSVPSRMSGWLGTAARLATLSATGTRAALWLTDGAVQLLKLAPDGSAIDTWIV